MKAFQIALAAAFVGIFLVAVFQLCQSNDKLSIEVFKSTFCDAEPYGRVGKGSVLYNEDDAKEGYCIILKKGGKEINRRYCLEKDIDYFANQMLNRELKNDSISNIYSLKYDSITKQLNNQ